MTPPPTSSRGHCRVTLVAPNNRVDVALPEDIPLADLLPDLLHLAGDPNPNPTTNPDTALTGYVLTGPGGWPLHTGLALTAQGIRHGDLLRLRPATEKPEPPVHDEIVDAVAEAALTTSHRWTATTLRTTSLAALATALVLGATVLWFAGATSPRAFHGSPSVLAALLAMSTFTAGVVRARLGGKLKTWATYRPIPPVATRRRPPANSRNTPLSTMALGNQPNVPNARAHIPGSRGLYDGIGYGQSGWPATRASNGDDGTNHYGITYSRRSGSGAPANPNSFNTSLDHSEPGKWPYTEAGQEIPR